MDSTHLRNWKKEIGKGLLELRILRVLATGPAYGGEILRKLRDDGGASVSECSVYQALRRLLRAGLANKTLMESSGGAVRKVCELTEHGKKELGLMEFVWGAVTAERLPRPKEGLADNAA